MYEPHDRSRYPDRGRTLAVPDTWDSCVWRSGSGRSAMFYRAPSDDHGVVAFDIVDLVGKSKRTRTQSTDDACTALRQANCGSRYYGLVPGTSRTSTAIGLFAPMRLVIFLVRGVNADQLLPYRTPVDARGRTQWWQTEPLDKFAPLGPQYAGITDLIDRLRDDERDRR